jgi:hypothetical protein
MANVSRINGFNPVKMKNGAPWNGMANLYFIPSSDGTATFVGDAVKLAGSASTDGYPTVAQAAATNPVLGVVIGFKVNPSDLNLSGSYRAASTDRYVLVVDDPDVVFEVQEDAVGGALAVTDIGLNAEIVVGSGSTTTGKSGMQLDTSTKATTATLVLKTLGFVDRVDNEIGSANSKVLVLINNHQRGSSTGTAGV